jgi:hypothetical protein
MKRRDDKKDFFAGRYTGGSLGSAFWQMTRKHPDFLFAPATSKI